MKFDKLNRRAKLLLKPACIAGSTCRYAGKIDGGAWRGNVIAYVPAFAVISLDGLEEALGFLFLPVLYDITYDEVSGQPGSASIAAIQSPPLRLSFVDIPQVHAYTTHQNPFLIGSICQRIH